MKWKTKFIETMKRYKHAWVFLYALIYMPWFWFLEKHVTMNYHVVQTALDEEIPFIEYFIVPYMLWFVFIAATFKWMAGFGFSAGFVDFFLSLRNPNANSPYMLIVLGLVFFVLYYLIFSVAIAKFNIKTPGREDEDMNEDDVEVSVASDNAQLAAILLPLLGGKENIVIVDNCTTRLRLEVKDSSIVRDAEIKKYVPGVLKPSQTAVQVIVGPQVEFVADELKKLV